MTCNKCWLNGTISSQVVDISHDIFALHVTFSSSFKTSNLYSHLYIFTQTFSLPHKSGLHVSFIFKRYCTQCYHICKASCFEFPHLGVWQQILNGFVFEHSIGWCRVILPYTVAPDCSLAGNDTTSLCTLFSCHYRNGYLYWRLIWSNRTYIFQTY